jgi:hypothetical protein
VSRPQGWISPSVVVDGRIVGVWAAERKGDKLTITVTPLGKLARAALHDAAERTAAASGNGDAKVTVSLERSPG